MTDVHYCSPDKSRSWLFYTQCPHCDNLCVSAISANDDIIDCTPCRCRQITDDDIRYCVCLTAASEKEVAAHSCKYFVKRKEE